jgi:hypothetical protein
VAVPAIYPAPIIDILKRGKICAIITMAGIMIEIPLSVSALEKISRKNPQQRERIIDHISQFPSQYNKSV